VLYMAQLVHTEGRAYNRRKLSQGKTSMEAMRCPRRRLSDVVYRQLVTDAAARTDSARAVSDRADQADPGGHSGTTLQSSVTDLTPHIGSSDKPLPGPAPVRLPVSKPAENHRDPGASRPPAPPRRRRQRGAPHRTNDVDADQRRRTIEGSPDTALDNLSNRREP